MTRHLTDQLISRLSQYVAGRFGLHFPKKRWRELDRRMVQATRELGSEDPESCLMQLLATPPTKAQEEILVRHLTIGETYFFREPKSFEILEKSIIPALIAARRGKDQRLRFWSAGCASGEEPYSLAILLSRLLPDLGEWNITILATDLNPQALAKAARGVYSAWSFRGMPPGLRDRYFSPSGEKGFAISDAIRRMVTFSCLNLAQDSYPALANNTNAMDVIFCRNVLMYFAHDQVQRVSGNFSRALLEGGWLVVSPCEATHQLFPDFAPVPFPEAIFYRKKGPAAAPPQSAPFSGELTLPAFVPEPLPASSLPAREALPAPVAATAAKPPEPSPYAAALELYDRGRYGEAAARLTRLLVDSGPGTGSVLPDGKTAALLTRTFANLGQLDEALHWSDQAIVAARLDPELHFLRATILQEKGELAEAMAALKRVLYLDHDFALAHFTLGNLCLHQGKKREAARHFTNTLTLLESHPADEILPGAEGMTVERMVEIIGALRAAAGSH